MVPFFLLALVAGLLVNVVEMVLYLALVLWYYRAGPALTRHVWHTRVPESAAIVALGSALDGSKLVWRGFDVDGAAFIAARKRFSRVSMWPRFAFTVLTEAGSDSATITCESRPYVSPLLLLPPLLFAPAGQFFPVGLYFNAALVLFIAIAYIGFWYWERDPRELDRIRQSLTTVGVRVCPRCGYDLRASPDRCPECGAAHGLSTGRRGERGGERRE